MSRLKAVCVTLVLLLGFAIPAAPYTKIRGKILPPKLERLVSSNTLRQSDRIEISSLNGNAGPYTASAMSTDILNALGRLAQEISDNLMHFFVLPLVVGFYSRFHKLRRILLTERFFIFALIVLYVVIMVLLHTNYDYISRRHCMPVVVFTSFYIVVGLQILARWLSRKVSKNSLATQKDRKRWFFILMVVGLIICATKFTRITPLRWEKQGYLDTAKWLNKNTAPTDIIAVPDKRIAFYAERKWLEDGEQIPEQVDYIVRIVRSEDEKIGFGKDASEEYSTWLDKRKKSRKLTVYKVIR